MTTSQLARPMISRRSVSESEWRGALWRTCSEDNQIASAYQPVVELQTGAVRGFEMLARFPGEPHGSPEAWFAAASRHGLEGVLAAFIVRGALAARHLAGSGRFLAVNVTPRALLAAEVQSAFRSSGRLDGIVVEVTEQAALGAYDALNGALAPLRALGATVVGGRPRLGLRQFASDRRVAPRSRQGSPSAHRRGGSRRGEGDGRANPPRLRRKGRSPPRRRGRRANGGARLPAGARGGARTGLRAGSSSAAHARPRPRCRRLPPRPAAHVRRPAGDDRPAATLRRCDSSPRSAPVGESSLAPAAAPALPPAPAGAAPETPDAASGLIDRTPPVAATDGPPGLVGRSSPSPRGSTSRWSTRWGAPSPSRCARRRCAGSHPSCLWSSDRRRRFGRWPIAFEPARCRSATTRSSCAMAPTGISAWLPCRGCWDTTLRRPARGVAATPMGGCSGSSASSAWSRR